MDYTRVGTLSNANILYNSADINILSDCDIIINTSPLDKFYGRYTNIYTDTSQGI